MPAQVLQFLGNPQCGFVCFPRLCALTGCAQRIPEVRVQNAPQSFHAVACREPFSDTHAFPKLCDRQIGPPAKVRASTQPFEHHRPAVARRITEPGEDGLEDLRRPIQLTCVQQLLATIGVRKIPITRTAGFLFPTLPAHRYYPIVGESI